MVEEGHPLIRGEPRFDRQLLGGDKSGVVELGRAHDRAGQEIAFAQLGVAPVPVAADQAERMAVADIQIARER